MDEIDRRIDEKQRQLAEVLEPSFAAAEDADLAATMLVMALDQPVEGEDQSSYLAALERLPKGSTANPRVLLVSPYDEGADLARRLHRWPRRPQKLTALSYRSSGKRLRDRFFGAAEG